MFGQRGSGKFIGVLDFGILGFVGFWNSSFQNILIVRILYVIFSFYPCDLLSSMKSYYKDF